MPSRRATAQTCCPAAPPKPTSAKPRGSTPRRTDTSWIACAMRAFAISTKPAAVSSSERAWPAAASASADARERLLHRRRAQREREALPAHAAEEQVHVGERELARAGARAVAERPRLGARALRPDREREAVEAAERAAARGHGVDAQHRRAHADPGHDASRRRDPSRRPPPARRRWRCRPCRSRSRARGPPAPPRAPRPPRRRPGPRAARSGRGSAPPP